MKILCTSILFLAVCQPGSAQTQKTWDGFVTDTHCGKNCQRILTMTLDPRLCALLRQAGIKYGLWYGNHVYELEPQSKASEYAAENVRVTGELSNDTIRIHSITRIQAPQTQSQ